MPLLLEMVSINIASSFRMMAEPMDGDARGNNAVLIRVRGYMTVYLWVV